MNNDLNKILSGLKKDLGFQKIIKNSKNSIYYKEADPGNMLRDEADDDFGTPQTPGNIENQFANDASDEMTEETPVKGSPIFGLLISGILGSPMRNYKNFAEFNAVVWKEVYDNNMIQRLLRDKIFASQYPQYDSFDQAINVLQNKRKERKAIEEGRQRIVTWIRDEIDKHKNDANGNTTIKEILSGSYDVQKIKATAQSVGVGDKLISEDGLEKWKLYFDLVNKVQKGLGDPFLKIIGDVIEQLKGGTQTGGDITKALNEMKPENFDYLLNLTAEILGEASPNIDEALKSVQNETGNQVSGGPSIVRAATGVASLAGLSKDKEKNKKIQNVIGHFILYTFIYLAIHSKLEGDQTEVNQEDWFKHFEKRILRTYYNEFGYDFSEGKTLTNIVSGIKGLYYDLGKQYTSMGQAVPDIQNILLKLRANPQLTQKITAGIDTSGDGVKVLTAMKDKNIIKNSVAEQQAKGNLKSAFDNKEALREQIKTMAGFTKTTAAKIGGAIGKLVGGAGNIISGGSHLAPPRGGELAPPNPAQPAGGQ